MNRTVAFEMIQDSLDGLKQSRVLEHELFARGVPYKVYGGLRFFERAEIKDAMAYLRLVANPDDDAAFLRAVVAPRREVGATTLEKLGYDPLPRYYEPPASPYSTPELAEKYPLILITGGRVQPFYHSEYRQVEKLRKVHPEPQLQINPEKARELGIEDGEWVWIETPLGRITQKATYFTGIDPRVVHAEHAWWFPEEEGAEPHLYGVFRSNANVLVDEDPEICNQISGGFPTRGMLCRVYKK